MKLRPSSLILRSVSFARSFPPKVSSGARARGALGTETLHKIQCRKFRASIRFQSTPVTSFERAIAAFLLLRRRLAGKLERSGPVADGVRFPAIFSSHEGPLRLIQNFCRPLVAAGKPSFLCSLVQDCRQAASSIFETFQFAPSLSFVPINHAHKKAWRRSHDVQRNKASGA